VTIPTINILEKMDKEDREKVSYFINILLNQSKYQKLREEIFARREEIKKGETLNHEDFWDKLNV